VVAVPVNPQGGSAVPRRTEGSGDEVGHHDNATNTGTQAGEYCRCLLRSLPLFISYWII